MKFQPPKEFNRYQKELWKRIYKSRPEGWFDAANIDLLRLYCISMNKVNDLEKALALKFKTPASINKDYATYSKRTADIHKHSKASEGYMRSMRITQQARSEKITLEASGRGKKASNKAEEVELWEE